ncbi:MAG: F0F1 ATP synthase subunit A [Chloroflexota bacterium]|nr:F0F1 ATP synthase subunit A [Chloroflexota bacterium]
MSDPGNVTDASAAPAEATDSAPAPARRSFLRRYLWHIVVAVVILDILAFVFIPPYQPDAGPGHPVTGIPDLIQANLEIPAPHVVYALAPDPNAPPPGVVSFHPSITSSIITTWLVMAIVLIFGFLSTRRMRDVPGRYQNFIELTFEKLEDWAVSLGGEPARKHIPVFTAFFLFILVSNWSGLIPVFGKIEALRAPTSDVNVTFGLAIVVFIYFQFQGFRALGVRHYLGKFFVFSGFRDGIGAGLIGLFVGLIEFMLEFIKPVTLAMRLFGNIFGGEVALGVITALTIAAVPSIMMLLEGLLNFIQALIFSTLMLMYTVIAVESHAEEAHDAPAFADLPEGNIGAPMSGVMPAH